MHGSMATSIRSLPSFLSELWSKTILKSIFKTTVFTFLGYHRLNKIVVPNYDIYIFGLSPFLSRPFQWRSATIIYDFYIFGASPFQSLKLQVLILLPQVMTFGISYCSQVGCSRFCPGLAIKTQRSFGYCFILLFFLISLTGTIRNLVVRFRYRFHLGRGNF